MLGKYSILIIILLMLFNGCVHLPLRVEDEYLPDKYLQQGKQSEANDDQISALRFYKLAVTVEPSNQEAVEGCKRMEKVLHDSAEKHYRTGLKLNNEGQYGQARQHFLMALHLRPDHPEIAKILTTRKRNRIKGYVLYSIKSGESLARIARRYYGDESKFSIIAQYNNLTDATHIRVGQEIKVPEIEGLEFLIDKENVETANPKGGYQASPVLEDPMEEAVDTLLEKEFIDRIDDYRKQGIRLFQEDKYLEAIDEFNKVLAIAQDDEDSLEYIHKSHYELAMTLFKNKDYYAARDQFRASIQYRDDCITCVEYLQKSEELYKELHYKKGMQYYEDEQLVEAIKEWELVIALDPDYKKAGYHIDKAKVTLTKLEEFKKSQKEGE
ncbi:MAG: LysM peptidoglycan-binding domain-containing protein [Desulfobacterales bacterium]|nr:LysM peptidoglycan-binding domain-containing protein [Desulfobacterales bacterium]